MNGMHLNKISNNIYLNKISNSISKITPYMIQ